MSNLKIIANTKGGVGKSTFSNHILPVVLQNSGKKIVIVEVDGSNDTQLSNTNLEINNNSDSIDVIKNLRFDVMTEENTIYIIDVGGSDDTKKLLKKLSETNLEADFYIPTNDDWEQFHNIKETLKRVQKCNHSSINLVLNRCESLDQKSIKKQFLNLYSKNEKMEEKIVEIEGSFDETFYIPNIPILSMIKGRYKQFLLDSLKTQKQFKKDFVENEKSILAKKDKVKYMKLLDDEEIADKIINLENVINVIFEDHLNIEGK